MSCSDCKVASEERLGRLLRRGVSWDLFKVESDKDGEEGHEMESEEEEELPLTVFAHLEIASSTFAAMAPKRLVARTDEVELDVMEGAG